MNNTSERTPHHTAERPIEHSFDTIKNLLFQNVLRSEEYLSRRGHNVEQPDAIREAILEIVSRQTSDQARTSAERPAKPALSESDKTALHVVAELGRFIEAQHELRRDQATQRHQASQRDPAAQRDQRDITERERIRHLKLEYVIPYNHIIKEFVNNHPNDNIEAVSSALASTYQFIYGRYHCLPASETHSTTRPTQRDVYNSIKNSLDGMRHEVATEGLLQAANLDYDYNITADEDANGADIFVQLNGRREAVDIKASESAVARSQQDYRFSQAVWTGLTKEDFTGLYGTATNALSIPYDTVITKADAFAGGVKTMVRRNQIAKQKIATRAAKRALERERK